MEGQASRRNSVACVRLAWLQQTERVNCVFLCPVDIFPAAENATRVTLGRSYEDAQGADVIFKQQHHLCV